jgi:hypothetical protein
MYGEEKEKVTYIRNIKQRREGKMTQLERRKIREMKRRRKSGEENKWKL